jgi:hypothetical protein
MKKALFVTALALLCIFSFGQTIQKGSLMGIHVVVLKAGVSTQDYVNFCRTKWIPAFEKAYPGAKAYLLQSARGIDSGSIGIIMMFKSEADRNKYWTTTGVMTAAGQAASKKMADAIGKDEKFEDFSAPDKYNDWVIQ